MSPSSSGRASGMPWQMTSFTDLRTHARITELQNHRTVVNNTSRRRQRYPAKAHPRPNKNVDTGSEC